MPKERGCIRPTMNDFLETRTIQSSNNHYVKSNGFFIFWSNLWNIQHSQFSSWHSALPDNNHDKIKFVNDIFYSEEPLYIPQGPARLHVLQARHDFLRAGYFGFNKMLEFITSDFGGLKCRRSIRNLLFLAIYTLD